MAGRKHLWHRTVGLAWVAVAASVVGVAPSAVSAADPISDAELFQPLPMFAPTPSDWTPEFPFPYDETRGKVTDAEIAAQGEMCQWYNAQFDTLLHQIERFQFNRIQPDGTDWNYTIGDLPRQSEVVIGNIDRSVAFLAPRAQALTQARDHAGNVYFPLYQGESFHLLWQHLSNVGNGIKSHQPAWFTGPSLLRVKRWGSRIHRSHVCD